MRRLASALATSLLLIGLLPSAATAGDLAPSDDYRRAYRIGLEAYTYGLPLLTTNSTFLTMTSTNVSQGAYGPVNQFNNVRGANTASSTAVVAPGSTSLSSIAWLDLGDEPQVLHVPEVTDRDFVLALIDPYTTNLVNLGTASHTPPGDYVICDPTQCHTPLPARTHRLDVDYSRIWIIGSTQLKGADDVAAVNAIQDQYTLTPLSAFGTTPTAPAAPATPTPVTEFPVPTDLALFDELGAQLQQFAPPAADAPALRRFASVGIGAGRTPSTDSALSAETRRGLAAAVAAGPARIERDIKAEFAADFDTHNGYLLGGFGTYGTDYRLRAVISQVGLGAFTAHQAIYAMTWTDKDAAALDGSARYVLHLTTPPPTDEGWSLTVYSLQGALMANPLNRYAFTDTSALHSNADGSIDLYLQADAPTDPAQQANWLPITAGQGFEITWRLFAPRPNAVNGILTGTGWQPPKVTRIG